MLKNYTHYIYILTLILSIAACSEEENPKFEKDNFTSIFDTNEFDSAYYPIDIKQTEDEGFLVLAKRRLEGEFAGVYILKANKFGNFESHVNVDPQLVNPVGSLMPVGDTFYFFCMDAGSKITQLVGIDQKGNIVSSVASTLPYPCASAPSGEDRFVVLNYDHVDKRTIIAIVDPNTGGVLRQSAFRIGIGGEDKVEEDIINHFFQFGRKLPFFVGQVSNDTYFFNGFYDYTFSLVFTRLGADNQLAGIIQGQHDDGGFSAALPLGGNRFAASIFNFGDNYILPNKTIEITPAPNVVTNMGGFTLPELVPNANIRIAQVTVKEKKVIIFAGDTKAKQIGLWFYDEEANRLMSSRYFGFSNPFEVGNITSTLDGGLAICGTTYLAGRFPRICIFKISKEELEGQVKTVQE